MSIETRMSVDSEVSGMTYAARIAYMVLAWLFVVALLAQVYLIGLVFLAAQPTLDAHVGFGHTVGILLLPMLILTYVARHPRSLKVRTWGLFGIYILQAEVFAIIRESLPVVAALHPVLALALFGMSVSVALRAGAYVRRDVASPMVAPRPTESTQGLGEGPRL
ncbi:MAG: DUF6220 domain-containing protein [Anaerolineae bacterium]